MSCQHSNGVVNNLRRFEGPRLRLQQLERVRPAGAAEAGDAPEDAQRLDRARGLDRAPSSVSKPNCLRIVETVCFAGSLFPQMNIVGGPPGSIGLTISAFPTHENALTKFAAGASRCSRSISESFAA